MSGQTLERLKRAVDLLGPNMWLHLDEVSFPRFFDGPLRQGSPAVERARAFAHEAGCVFVLEPGVAKFGRAYFKPEADV